MANQPGELDGLVALQKALQSMLNRLPDLRTFKKELQDSFHETMEEQFKSQGGLSGGWEKLSPGYAAWKNKRYPGATILVATGAMRASLVSNTSDSIFKVTKDSVTVGTTDEKATKHQYGDPDNPNLPIREVIPYQITLTRMSEAWQTAVLKAMAEAWNG